MSRLERKSEKLYRECYSIYRDFRVSTSTKIYIFNLNQLNVISVVEFQKYLTFNTNFEILRLVQMTWTRHYYLCCLFTKFFFFCLPCLLTWSIDKSNMILSSRQYWGVNSCVISYLRRIGRTLSSYEPLIMKIWVVKFSREGYKLW